MQILQLLFVFAVLLAIAWTAKGDAAASHFEPQVAMLCPSKADQTYHSQFMLESGHWTTDLSHKVSCYRDKLDILEYCKKIYPKHDIRNIVESSNYVKISNWCKVGHAKCKHTDWVKPYRCLEGPFQSDALLVPEHCVFDHIHNQSKCWEYERWNQTAAQSCAERDLSLRSFAMLLPCGISLFAGVEFVCCPLKDKLQAKEAILSPLALNKFGQYSAAEDLEDLDDEDDTTDEDEADDLKKQKDNKLPDDNDDDDEDDDDEEDDDDGEDPTYDAYENIVSPSSTAQPSTSTSPPVVTKSHITTRVPSPDPYFTHFEPKDEHQAFKEALQRLEEMHREKVTKVSEKVMKDWSDLEERYQDMRSKSPGVAEDFKQKMTLRFQQTVQSLEEEGNAEKHQLIAMHQQRVAARINQHKKDAMNCYTDSLNDVSPNTHKVQKCLQKLLRALHKDRHHTIAHYKHLLATNLDLASKERPMTLEHLVDIDHTINQSLSMLQRHPSLNAKIAELMSDYMQALRSKDETPGSLMSLTREAEENILDKYKAQVVAMQEDKERERFLEKQRKEVHKAEREELRAEKARAKAAYEAEGRNPDADATRTPVVSAIDLAVPVKSEAHGLSRHEMIQPAYAMTHDLSIGEPSYRRHEVHGPMTSDNKGVYVTVVFAGVAVMAAVFIAMTVLKRRSARSPQNLGFIEVDQAATPEERHVANMQINGYENPTYKYFEIKE